MHKKGTTLLLTLQRGVHILGSHRFAMQSKQKSSYIRVSIVSTDTEDDLRKGLLILKHIFEGDAVNSLCKLWNSVCWRSGSCLWFLASLPYKLKKPSFMMASTEAGTYSYIHENICNSHRMLKRLMVNDATRYHLSCYVPIS